MGGRLCWCVFVCGLRRWDVVVHACVHVYVMYTYAGNICLVVSGSASAHVFHMCVNRYACAYAYAFFVSGSASTRVFHRCFIGAWC